MHFIAHIPKREGTYHVRLYDVPLGHYKMSDHYAALQTKPAIEVSGDLVFDDGFGDQQSAFENEIAQGAISHNNFKIVLDADPVFRGLVSALRNLQLNIWMEVVLEARAESIGRIKPLVMIQPRKKRMYWWGKLSRNQATGYVDYQAFRESLGLIRDVKVPLHLGGLELNFIHWLHERFDQPAEPFLDYFKLTPQTDLPPGESSISNLLYELTHWISPCELNMYADQRLVTTDSYDNEDDLPSYRSIARANIMPGFLLKSTSYAAEFANDMCFYVDPSPTFFKDAGGNHGPNSLYTRWKNLGDAYVMLLREIFVKGDCELPILEDFAGGALFSGGNTLRNRNHIPERCARWVFWALERSPITVTARPVEQTIKYTPCAIWLAKIKITMPEFDRHSYPTALPEQNIPGGEGLTLEYATIWGFIGIDSMGFDDVKNIELLVRDAATNDIEYASSVEFSFGEDIGEQTVFWWSDFHIYNWLNRWGSPRALVEFEQDQSGVTEYPAGMRGFGFLEFGDFRNMRNFSAAPGLLFDAANEAGVFAVIEVSHTPGGNTRIKGLEVKVLDKSHFQVTVPDPPPDPPDPPDPPIIPPDVAEPISGIHQLWWVEENPDRCIDHVDVFIDGVLQARLPGGNAYWQRFDFWFDSTAFSNGIHIFTICIYDCDGGFACFNFPFNVMN